MLRRRLGMQRAKRGFGGIFLIGPLMEAIRNLLFSREKYRIYKRAPFGSKTRGIIGVKLSMANKSKRTRYLTAKERAPGVTAVKGHQYARTGKVHGVPKLKEAA